MSTSTLTVATIQKRLLYDRRFYLIMACASAALIAVGFGPTYYAKFLFPMSPALSLLVHIHAFVFTAWMLYFIMQTALIAVDQPRLHRKLGIAGALLGSAMIPLGLAVSFTGLRRGRTIGSFDSPTTILLGLGDLLAFTVFFILGYLWRRNREAHQRLMLLSVVTGLVGPAFGRINFMGVVATPLVLLIALSFLLAGPLYDLITRHRVHPVYIYGCIFAIVTGPPIRVALAATSWWHRIAHYIVSM